jgi:hypothetical protein
MKFIPPLFVLVFSGCAVNVANPPQPLPRTQQLYPDAVRDAAIIEESEISTDLLAISPANPHLRWSADQAKVLVVTWKSQGSYEKYLMPQKNTANDEANVVWVSTAPEVQQFCQNYKRDHVNASKADIELRLKQYLGLNADWKYDVFVEMWVSPGDLFRPCVDPEVTDSTCNRNFQNPPPAVKGIKDYPAFYKNLYFADFRSLPGVPWTGLGYTYDWGNPQNEKGASEFILRPDAGYEIHKAIPTVDYCNPTQVR